jgi:hypothetical protein
MRRVRRRLKIRVRWTRVLLVIFAVVAVVAVGATALIADSLNRVTTSVTGFQRIVTALSTQPGTNLTLTDFDRLSSSVKELENSLAMTEARLSLFKPYVSINKNLEASLATLEIAHEISLAADAVLTGLQPTLFFMVAGSDSETVVTQISSGERIVELLNIGRGQFSIAKQHLDTAKAQLDALDLTGAASNVILEVQQLERYRLQLEQINSVLINAPDVLETALGINGDRNYLVFSQNNDELRPSGGYLSTYGWVTVRNGRVTNYSYSPTTATSPNPPQRDNPDQTPVPDWWIRYGEPIYSNWDGSWFADFPSTARMAMWYYNAGNNPQSPIDGALSIDITGFEELLRVMGAVTVPGYENSPVTVDNFRDVIYNIRDFGAGDIPHKRFLAALYQEIFSQWQTLSADQETNALLLGALLQGMQEKHFMLYFADDRLNDAVNLLGWSGAQSTTTDHDYLMVADANLGNKSNHSIVQSLTYDVSLQADGTISGRATVAYDYSARTASTDPAVNPEFNGPIDYTSLSQVFVPLGSTLTGDTRFSPEPTVVNNPANTAFVTRMLVPFDSNPRYQFSYVTPPLVENLGGYQRYRLLVQKQPGTRSNALNIQVMLPPGARLVRSTPAADASYELEQPILEFRTDLTMDRWFEVIYSLR